MTPVRQLGFVMTMPRAAATAIIGILLALQMLFAGAVAAGPAIPNYWDERERLPKPDLSGVERVRFLTTVDFPPFNFLDSRGRLTGFHVDLAKAICLELDIAERCQIQALPWDELDEAMSEGEGEALIAGTAITARSRETYAFTRPYLHFPARFLVPRASTTIAEPVHKSVSGERIGVIAGSAHEEMLRTYFPEAQAVTYSNPEWLYDDLKAGRLAAAFGDGMRMAFWLGGRAAENCCAFASGPYLAPEFLGAGLAIAVKREDAMLAQAFDFALREINVKGVFAELYLKYFPVGFY